MKEIKHYSDIDKILQKELVMIIAKTHTCSACKSIVQMLEHSIPNLHQIEMYSIYIDDIEQFKGDHLIFSVPTVLVFSNGKELLRESRYMNYSKISRLIDIYTT